MAPKKPEIEYVKISETHEFCGWIVRGCDGDNSKALILVDHRPKPNKWDGSYEPISFKPLADAVYECTGYGRDTVTVSYHITDKPHTGEELTAMVIAKICGVNLSGDLTAKYGHRYSEMTGYLWTDEKFQVGGHDVLAELATYWGKWCHLILTVHKNVAKRK